MPVLMALSRISVEKGQDRLLKALALWEKDPEFPASGAVVFICGTAGYRHAQAYEKNLIRHAQSLRKVRVIFPGYVHGVEKQASFRLANMYCVAAHGKLWTHPDGGVPSRPAGCSRVDRWNGTTPAERIWRTYPPPPNATCPGCLKTPSSECWRNPRGFA